MRKLTLLTAAAVSFTMINSLSMTADAAVFSPTSGGGRVIVMSGNSSESLEAALQNLKNCYPGLTIPGAGMTGSSLPNKPGNGQPENCPPGAPEQNRPNKPDSSLPNKPDNSLPNKPDNSLPNKPDSGYPDADQNKPGETPDSSQLTYAEQVARLVNEEREKQGLSSLTMKEDISAAARVRAAEIEISFEHTRPDGSSFSTALTEQNVSFRGSGENIAWGQKSPEEVMSGWMNSPGHRANILNESFTSIGVGYYQNSQGVNYWTQLFTY